MNHLSEGIVYTETTIYSPPEQYAADAPYQIAIIDPHSGDTAASQQRLTVRILASSPAERAQIGNRVTFVEDRNGVAYFRKAVPAK